MRTAALTLAPFLLLAVACAAEPEAVATDSGEDELVAARLSCVITSDPCPQASQGYDFGGCVKGVTLRQASDGSARVAVEYDVKAGGSKRVELVGRSGFDAGEGQRLSLTAAHIRGHLESGSSVRGMVNLHEDEADRFRGSLTLPAVSGGSMRGFSASCTRTGNTKCRFGNKSISVGASVPDVDGCNTCTCTERGMRCTELACAPSGCLVGGQRHDVGTSWPDADGCNTCSCSADGNAFCTEMACTAPSGCQVGGRRYAVGQSFPSSDGCNTCTCTSRGAACTELFCGGR